MNPTMTLILVLITFISFLFLLKISRWKPSSLPPSPPALPIVGNLHQLGRFPHRSLASLSKKYGPIILLRLGSVPAVVISSAEMAKEVMKTQDFVFSTRPKSSIASRLMYGPRDVAFMPYCQYWRQIRKICILHVLSNKRVQEFAPVRQEEVALMLTKIADASPTPVNLSNLLMTLTNDIICRAALGRKYSGEKGLKDVLKELPALLGSFPVRDFIPWLGWIDEISGLNARIRKNFEEIDEFLERVLEEHIDRRREAVEEGRSTENRHCDDFIDVLLSLQKKDDEKEDFTLEKDGLKGLILDIFAAGTNTSSSLMEWVMANLLSHPYSMEKVQEEIRRVAGSNVIVNEEDIDQMEYLKAIVKETLRIRTPIPLLLPREAMQEAKLQGYSIPVRTRIFINVWQIARDPENWEKPNEFWPERFLNNNIDYKEQDFSYVPFGSGRRACPGVSFALATVHHALANLLHRFDWDIPEEMKGQVLDMTESSGISARKKYGLILTAKPYN